MANVVLNFNQGFGSNFSGHWTSVHNWNLKLAHVCRDGQTRNGTLMKHVKVSDFCVMSHFNLGKEIVIAICSWSSPHTPTQAGACNKDPPSGAQLQTVFRLHLLCVQSPTVKPHLHYLFLFTVQNPHKILSVFIWWEAGLWETVQIDVCKNPSEICALCIFMATKKVRRFFCFF